MENKIYEILPGDKTFLIKKIGDLDAEIDWYEKKLEQTQQKHKIVTRILIDDEEEELGLYAGETKKLLTDIDWYSNKINEFCTHRRLLKGLLWAIEKNEEEDYIEVGGQK